LSPEELKDLVAGHRGLNPEQRTIIAGALEIRQRLLREVLVQRRAVFVLPLDTPIPRARQALAESGHSRAPIAYGGHLDDVVGVVTLRDLLDHNGTAQRSLTDVARPAVVFPETCGSPTAPVARCVLRWFTGNAYCSRAVPAVPWSSLRLVG
jgi:putative hemolysin